MDHSQRYARRDLPALAAFLALCAALLAIGGWITAGSVSSWYPTLDKPPFNPPDWLFGPVWTTLFVLIAIAGWRVWRRRHAYAVIYPLAVYALQLGLNVLWSLLFFGLQRPDLAAIEVVLFALVIAWNLRLFWGIDRLAGALLVPYLLWVLFATLLTISIWRLNP